MLDILVLQQQLQQNCEQGQQKQEETEDQQAKESHFVDQHFPNCFDTEHGNGSILIESEKDSRDSDLPPGAEKLVAGKALPEKGKLLQAVMEAGPLLQTLLLAGPLPQWQHPPPRVDTIEIPPSEDTLVELLQSLVDMDITFQALKETDIGRHVNRLRKHSSSEVKRLVKQVVRFLNDLNLLKDESFSLVVSDNELIKELFVSQVALGEKTAVLFTKDGDQHNNLHDMQCMWYELASGESYFRQGDLGRALKKFLSVEKHYADILYRLGYLHEGLEPKVVHRDVN
ncbi:hypothetical protein L484_005536 [Morus notabilis]|uniref:TFIIS N-terminal domain-containing protein n=1 Tax=Morus notabilis TaxID=981085 RepID=W9QPZ1_9ROSA|nr:hypothetical protein L484_005536 [Morus notabilis]